MWERLGADVRCVSGERGGTLHKGHCECGQRCRADGQRGGGEKSLEMHPQGIYSLEGATEDCALDDAGGERCDGMRKAEESRKGV